MNSLFELFEKVLELVPLLLRETVDVTLVGILENGQNAVAVFKGLRCELNSPISAVLRVQPSFHPAVPFQSGQEAGDRGPVQGGFFGQLAGQNGFFLEDGHQHKELAVCQLEFSDFVSVIPSDTSVEPAKLKTDAVMKSHLSTYPFYH